MWSKQNTEISKISKLHFYRKMEADANYYWSLCGHFMLSVVNPCSPYEARFSSYKCKKCSKILTGEKINEKFMLGCRIKR